MSCNKTGRPLIWGTSHVYYGDEFKCEDCGALITYSDSQSSFVPNAIEKLAHSEPIVMNKFRR
jgi:hypothetical protein